MQDFRKLNVWEKAHHITLEVYEITASFPAHEMYALAGQLRRAVASVRKN